jgi:ubiquitin-conjugating enzyme E2 variant
MAPPLEQRDAQELKQGYAGWFRWVEIASILGFWALMLVIAYRLKPLTQTMPWLLLAAASFGFLLADFVSGFVHWMADTWGSPDLPLIGNSLVRPFRLHHVDPKAMTHHDYIETNGSNCLISIPWAIGASLIPFDGAGGVFAATSISSMIFWVMMTNQIHKWSHLEPEQTPALLRWLQRLHIVLPPEHHEIHHRAPFDKYYCITTGWLNWPLHKLGFFRFMERLVTAVFGLIPRRDDIGLDAALELAPLRPQEPSGQVQIDLPRS